MNGLATVVSSVFSLISVTAFSDALNAALTDKVDVDKDILDSNYCRFQTIFNTIFKMNSKVSIVVPVYGVEKYIERCARSLFTQTFGDIEYILLMIARKIALCKYWSS